MSFSFRDRPSLSERLRGRTGDQLLQDLEKEIEEDRKMFFDRTPGWSTTPRSGSFSRAFPFDETPRRQDIRSHLEDLANRHPEFADHLRCPPWGGEVGARSSRWDRKQQSADGHKDEDRHSQASNSSSTGSEGPGPSCADKQGGLSHHGLRNTVDIGQQQHASNEQTKEARGQRSMSAPPPDNRSQGSEHAPPRYVTRLNITPSTNVDGPRSDQGKPPVAPKQQPPQAQHHHPPPPQQQPTPPKQSGGNVRHIPIFVEGRDEPILPKNVEPSYVPKPPHAQQSPPSHTFGRPVFSAHHQFEPQPQPMPQTPPQNRKFQQTRPQQHPPQQQPPPPPPPPQTQVPQQAQQPPSKPQQPPANDPISRVMAVQKDVNELAARVDNFSCTSRRDKEYIYLDEMLTRNLLKLDDIETEGKENVRLARKEAIRAIQNCISVLEGKVPLPEEAGSAETVESAEATADQSEKGDISQPSEEAAPEQEMDVEQNASETEQGDVGKVETMEVETSAANGPEDVQTMEVELAKEADGVGEKAADTPLAAEASEIELPATAAQADQAAPNTNVASDQLEACLPQKVENSPDTSEMHESKESAELGKMDKPTELGTVKEASVAESKAEDTSAVKSVDEARASADDVNKESENPKPKGKGIKVKRDGAKTRKGKASKSAERKSVEEPAASEPAPAEHSEVKVSGADSQESGHVAKVA